MVLKEILKNFDYNKKVNSVHELYSVFIKSFTVKMNQSIVIRKINCEVLVNTPCFMHKEMFNLNITQQGI